MNTKNLERFRDYIRGRAKLPATLAFWEKPTTWAGILTSIGVFCTIWMVEPPDTTALCLFLLLASSLIGAGAAACASASSWIVDADNFNFAAAANDDGINALKYEQRWKAALAKLRKSKEADLVTIATIEAVLYSLARIAEIRKEEFDCFALLRTAKVESDEERQIAAVVEEELRVIQDKRLEFEDIIDNTLQDWCDCQDKAIKSQTMSGLAKRAESYLINKELDTASEEASSIYRTAARMQQMEGQ